MDALLIYKDRKFVGKELLRGSECILGRGGDIVLNSPQVSRRHAAIRRKGGRYLLVDLGSANGTMLNRRPLPAPNAEEALRSGDLIEIGEFQLRCLFAASGERLAVDLAAAPEVLERASLPPVESMEETVKRLRVDALPGVAVPAPQGEAPAAPPAPPPPAAPPPPPPPASPPPAPPPPPPPAAAPREFETARKQVVPDAAPADRPPPAAPSPPLCDRTNAETIPIEEAMAKAAARAASEGKIPPEKAARPAARAARTASPSPAGDAEKAALAAPPAPAPTPAGAEEARVEPPPSGKQAAGGTVKMDLPAKTPLAASPAPELGSASSAIARQTATIKAFGTALEKLDALHQIQRARARLVIANEEVRNRVFIDKLEVTVGRTPGNDIAIGHQSVSSKHATIRFVGDGFAVTDHNSTNHTFVNGFQILPEAVVRIDDDSAVGFGAVSCLFVCDSSAFPGRQRPRRATGERVLQRLVEAGAVTRVQAKEALREAAEKECTVGEMVVLRGFLTPEQWSEACRTSEMLPEVPARRPVLWLVIAVLATVALVLGALVASGRIDFKSLRERPPAGGTAGGGG